MLLLHTIVCHLMELDKMVIFTVPFTGYSVHCVGRTYGTD